MKGQDIQVRPELTENNKKELTHTLSRFQKSAQNSDKSADLPEDLLHKLMKIKEVVIIEESDSRWSFPMVVVKRKNNKP